MKKKCYLLLRKTRFMSFSSSSCSGSFPFHSSEFGSSSISNSLAQMVWNDSLQPSFQNRTGRRNDNSAREHETAHCCTAVMQLFVSLLRTQYPEFAYLWPRVGIFKFSAKIFPSSYQPELKLCVSTKTLPVFFVAKATPPHSLSKPSELQSEEQSSISKSTCERTCSMTYTVSPLIELDVSSKLKQITKLYNHLLHCRLKHFLNQSEITKLHSEEEPSFSKSTCERTWTFMQHDKYI